MECEVIKIDEKDRWNEVVGSFAVMDVYYTNAYVRSFYKNGDGEAVLIYFHDMNTRAINVILKRDIAQTEKFKDVLKPESYYDIVTPYGYGGMLVEGDITNELETEYQRFCANQNIVSEFVRFHPLLKNQVHMQNICHVYKHGKTVAIDISDKKQMWNSFTSQNRNKIRKAMKNELTVHFGKEEWMLSKFMDIYTQTMKRDGASDYYYFGRSFFESVYQDLGDKMFFFYVKKEEEVIAMTIILLGQDIMHYHLSGSLAEYNKFAPVNLMLYQAALWGNEHGYHWFHLGGGLGAQEDSLFEFKKSFNRNETWDYYIGKKIWNTDMYRQLCDIAGIEADEKGYFPAYRA